MPTNFWGEEYETEPFDVFFVAERFGPLLSDDDTGIHISPDDNAKFCDWLTRTQIITQTHYIVEPCDDPDVVCDITDEQVPCVMVYAHHIIDPYE